MLSDMRALYHDQLDTIISDLVTMTGTVREAVRRATQALDAADGQLAEQVIADDAQINRAREVIEERAFEVMARQQPVAGDLRTLVAALRMVTDLERMGDLAVHVAKVTRMRYPDNAIPGELTPVIARMGEVAEAMIGATAVVLADRDVEVARDMEARDDEMDHLRAQLFRYMLAPTWSYGVEAAVDIALLGRYYERIADHAVSMARRVVYLVTGVMPTSSDPVTLS